MKLKTQLLSIAFIAVTTMSVSWGQTGQESESKTTEKPYEMKKYAKVKLTANISHLSENQKEMLKLLFQAADQMDQIFWMENVGEKDAFLSAKGPDRFLICACGVCPSESSHRARAPLSPGESGARMSFASSLSVLEYSLSLSSSTELFSCPTEKL